MADPITIVGQSVAPGERGICPLRLPHLFSHTEISMPIHVLHGASAGPVVLVCGAIHGDEINGVEIVRRVVDQVDPKALSGTLIAVPIVNVYGFITHSHNLPDERDLNRSFPGSKGGSLAGRLAYQFMTEVVNKVTHCIDLHTASHNRTHLPQVSGDLEDDETKRCAIVFGGSVFMHDNSHDGSLRAAAAHQGIAAIVYEAGEAQRFGRRSIDVGANGVLRLLTYLKMISGLKLKKRRVPTREVESSQWIRARESGILHLEVELGTLVGKNQAIGFVSDTMGGNRVSVRSPIDGLVIGHTRTPLVHRGDAIVHVACTKPSDYY